MKLSYWYAECLNDSDVYAVRERTKRDAVAEVKDKHDPENYGPVLKVTIEYPDAFGLMSDCTYEDRLYWEARAVLRHQEKQRVDHVRLLDTFEVLQVNNAALERYFVKEDDTWDLIPDVFSEEEYSENTPASDQQVQIGGRWDGRLAVRFPNAELVFVELRK